MRNCEIASQLADTCARLDQALRERDAAVAQANATRRDLDRLLAILAPEMLELAADRLENAMDCWHCDDGSPDEDGHIECGASEDEGCGVLARGLRALATAMREVLASTGFCAQKEEP